MLIQPDPPRFFTQTTKSIHITGTYFGPLSKLLVLQLLVFKNSLDPLSYFSKKHDPDIDVWEAFLRSQEG